MLNKTCIKEIVEEDVKVLIEKEKGYGDSWKRRGGVGAFMMAARKWDRIEEQSKKSGWDIFDSVNKFGGAEGVLDDIRDLRRYLILIESQCIAPAGVDLHRWAGDSPVNPGRGFTEPERR